MFLHLNQMLTPDAFWIVLTGILVAVPCALLGSFLMLRKMALAGDAISHAVLPGIAVAFLLSGQRDTLTLMLGAIPMGLLATFLIEYLHRKNGVQSDAATGLVYTALFAVGVLLISAFAGQIDLDQECILYGELAYAPLDTIRLSDGTNLGPRSAWIMGVTALLVIGLVVVFYRPLFLTTFDPAFAAAIGVSTLAWHYALMGAVSVTTISAFESVGAVLVVAFLTAPPAAAYLLTDRLPKMLALSALFGALSAIGGYVLAFLLDASIAGAMATAAGGLFGAVFLFAPRNGVVVSYFRQMKLKSNAATDFESINPAIADINNAQMLINKQYS